MFMSVIWIASVLTFLKSTLGSTVLELKSGHRDSTIASMKGKVAETLPRLEEVVDDDKPESKHILAFFAGAWEASGEVRGEWTGWGAHPLVNGGATQTLFSGSGSIDDSPQSEDNWGLGVRGGCGNPGGPHFRRFLGGIVWVYTQTGRAVEEDWRLIQRFKC